MPTAATNFSRFICGVRAIGCSIGPEAAGDPFDNHVRLAVQRHYLPPHGDEKADNRNVRGQLDANVSSLILEKRQFLWKIGR